MYSHLRIFALALFSFWSAIPSDGLEDFHGGSDGKESICNAGDEGDTGSIPGLGRSPGEGNGYPLQYLAWSIPWTEKPGGLQGVTKSLTQVTKEHFHFLSQIALWLLLYVP